MSVCVVQQLVGYHQRIVQKADTLEIFRQGHTLLFWMLCFSL